MSFPTFMLTYIRGYSYTTKLDEFVLVLRNASASHGTACGVSQPLGLPLTPPFWLVSRFPNFSRFPSSSSSKMGSLTINGTCFCGSGALLINHHPSNSVRTLNDTYWTVLVHEYRQYARMLWWCVACSLAGVCVGICLRCKSSVIC